MIAELFYMDTTIWARTPYDASFVSELKERIPKEYRYWDKDERVWVINYSYEEELLALCNEYFEQVAKFGQKKYVKAIQSLSAYQTLHLLPTAPKELIVAAYRVLSKLYHPDVSKEVDANEKMKKINIAFDEIMGGK